MISALDIQTATARYFDLTVDDLKGRRLAKAWARPRQIGMAITRELRPDMGLPRIGHYFGGRDHTTALYAVRRVAELRESEPSVAVAYHTIKSAVLATEAAKNKDLAA